MTKEVTSTEIKLAKLVIGENGLPIAEVIPSHVILGEITLEKAQKLITKKYPTGTTIYGMEVTTDVYKMEVSEFIKVATKVTEEDNTEEETDEDEDEETPEPTPEPPKGNIRRITKEQA